MLVHSGDGQCAHPGHTDTSARREQAREREHDDHNNDDPFGSTRRIRYSGGDPEHDERKHRESRQAEPLLLASQSLGDGAHRCRTLEIRVGGERTSGHGIRSKGVDRIVFGKKPARQLLAICRSDSSAFSVSGDCTATS
jgi:hypothetical protein